MHFKFPSPQFSFICSFLPSWWPCLPLSDKMSIWISQIFFLLQTFLLFCLHCLFLLSVRGQNKSPLATLTLMPLISFFCLFWTFFPRGGVEEGISLLFSIQYHNSFSSPLSLLSPVFSLTLASLSHSSIYKYCRAWKF